MADPVPGRDEYARFINEQLAAEEGRKNSLEARALSVISTSGALATLVFAVAAFAGPVLPEHLEIPGQVYAGLAFFVVAAVFALVIQIPLHYEVVRVEPLRAAVKQDWDDDYARALQKTSATQIKSLATSRRLNTFKAWMLISAVGSEVLAVLLVASSVERILKP